MQADYPGAAKPQPPDPPVYMTDAEAIAAVRAGGRCLTKHCLRPLNWVVPEKCTNLRGDLLPDHALWRTVACDGDTDVVECSRCGKQRLAACDFDDEYD